MPTTSPFLQPPPVASPDSLAILHLKRDLLTPTILRTYDDENLGYAEGKVTTTRYGNYPHSTLIGQPWGSQIKASKVDTGTRGRIGLQGGRGSKRKRDGSSRSHGGEQSLEGEDLNGQAQNNEATGAKEPKDAGETKEVKVPVQADTGFCHLLPPTPEIWTASLPHRTQVVYTPDYSYILQRLRVTPGTTVIEAGAGSGSFTHAAARAVFNGYPKVDAATGSGDQDRESEAGTGRVYSFEFHEPRAQKLQEEIQDHGLNSLVTITHSDVYTDGFNIPTSTPSQHLPINATAIFLDLPAPWLALKHLTRTPTSSSPSPLNPSTSVHLCTFSPCIEQVQRTVSALRAFGWLDIEMVELSARHIESRRDRVGLQEEGLRGVNATPANVDEAVNRLREVEGRDRSYHHGMTVKTLNDSMGGSSLVSMDGSEDGVSQNDKEYVSKRQRLQNIKDAQASRKLFREGRLVSRSEPEIKMHTSYLVFAVLPRVWTEEDERRAQEEVQSGLLESGGVEKPTSKRQEKKKAAKDEAEGDGEGGLVAVEQ